MKHQKNKIQYAAPIMVALFLAMTQAVVAEVITMQEGTTIERDDHTLRLKKAEDYKGGYCKIKVDKIKDQKIFVGSTATIGSFHIQATYADGEKCTLVINNQDQHPSYDIIDTLNIPQQEISSEIKSYQVNGKTILLMITHYAPEQASVKIQVTLPSGQQEETNMLTRGGLYTFSDGSTISVIELRENIQVQLGIRVNVPEPAVKLHASDESTPSSQESAVPKITPQRTKENPGEEAISETKEEPQKKKCAPEHCYINSEFNTCLPVRTRLRVDNIPSYCDVDSIIKPQKQGNEQAEQSYECQSNVIQKGACLPLKKKPIFSKMAKFVQVFG